MKNNFWFLAALVAGGAALGCNKTQRSAAPPVEAQPDASAEAGAPFADDGFVRLPELKDENPAPNIVEVSLTARVAPIEVIDGRPHDQLTYDGSVPGPLIRARRGDTLIVHLENELPIGTTIHWHGLRVPNGMDGVPNMTQPLVEPGMHFRYEFALPDASVFWYHPHFETLASVGGGLYGALLVEDPEEAGDLGTQTVMAISDLSLYEDGTVQEHGDSPAVKIAGREGATLLLNGRPDQQMNIQSGQRLRWRVLNMARSRYLDLKLEGHRFLRIGSDGGRIEFPVEEDIVRLVPGERVDLIVEPRGQVGSFVNLVTLPVNRGEGASTAAGPEVLMRLNFIAGPEPQHRALPKLSEKLESFPHEDAQEIEIGLTMDTDGHGMVRMGINGVPWDESSPLHATIGRPQIWNIINHSSYNHPFHLHGFHFQVIDENGVAESPLQLKDTVDIPPLSQVRLVPEFNERPGMWMFHCHILDHAESGMMGVLHLHEAGELVDAGAPPDGWTTPPGPPTTPGTDGEVRAFLAELLDAETYKEPPWTAETSKPREKSSVVSPHGDVRVYANDVLLRSIAAGNSVSELEDGTLTADFQAPGHTPGSIAVKEFYDGDVLVGKAALLSLDGAYRDDAAYYCDGEAHRCGTPSLVPPVYGEGPFIACGTCHGGMVFTVTYP